jgi:hypothetical protein
LTSRIPTALLATATLALTASACGGSQAEEPADLVPAGAPIYLEVSLDSEEQVAGAEALIAELGEVPAIGSTLDPEALIATALEESAADAGVDFSYAEDVEPWLGRRGALAFLSLDGFATPEPVAGEATDVVAESEPENFVLILEASDEQIARDSLRRLIEADGETTAEDVEIGGEEALEVPDDDLYVAFPQGFVVLAPTEEAVAAAVESPGDEPLNDSDELAQAQEGLPPEWLGFGFVDLSAAVAYALETGGIAQDDLDAVREIYGDALEQPVGAALTAAERSLALDIGSGFLPEGLGVVSGPTELMGDAPEDALGVSGFGDLSESAALLLDRLDEIAAAAADDTPTRDALAQGFERAVGVPLDDAVGALGETSVWVRGSPPESYSVAIEMTTGDPRVAGRLLDAIGRSLASDGFRVGPAGTARGFEAVADPFLTAGSEFGFVTGELRGDRVTLTLATSRAAASDLPAGAIAGTPGYEQALSALGDDFEISTYADLGAILDLVVEQSSAFDVITGETAPEQFVIEYLAGKLGFAAAGVRADGERTIQRLVAGLR